MKKVSLKKIAAKDVAIAITEDLGSGDITTNLLGKDKNKLSTAIVKSNEDAILMSMPPKVSWSKDYDFKDYENKLLKMFKLARK